MRTVVLHVEDDQDEVFLLRRAFSRARQNYHFFHAENGEEAINYLNGDRPYSSRDEYPLPHVMLLDLKMPGRNGFEVLEWTRNQDSFKNLPIIVLSSSDRPEDLQRAFDLGATSYLNKTVSCENVMGMLSVLVDQRVQASDLDRSPGLVMNSAGRDKSFHSDK